MRTNFVTFSIFHFKCVCTCVYLCVCACMLMAGGRRVIIYHLNNLQRHCPFFLLFQLPYSINHKILKFKLQIGSQSDIDSLSQLTSTLPETITLFQVSAFSLRSRVSIISLIYLFFTEFKIFTICPVHSLIPQPRMCFIFRST